MPESSTNLHRAVLAELAVQDRQHTSKPIAS